MSRDNFLEERVIYSNENVSILLGYIIALVIDIYKNIIKRSNCNA